MATGYVDELLMGQATASSPLLLGSAARMLAATALTLFPNTLVTPPGTHDRTDAHPRTLRRAVAFIGAHPEDDVSVADIARAAYVTPRAVQLAFRRHLDTTPLGYLRRVRLERAHDDLRLADPERTTVTAIAARWGFGDHSRFAAYYVRAYGRSPSTTLHDRRP